jgi:hypothetical protein
LRFAWLWSVVVRRDSLFLLLLVVQPHKVLLVSLVVNPSIRKKPDNNQQVLDAPSLLDYFYANLVDWSSQNMLVVGMDTCVYLCSASNSKVTTGHGKAPIFPLALVKGPQKEISRFSSPHWHCIEKQ